MANAADYLQLNTTQLLNTYKLRTRSIDVRTFVATNIASNYVLNSTVTSNNAAITLTPTSFILQPNESITVTVEYDTTQLETLSAGTLEGALNFSVAATPVVIPLIPTPPASPPLPESPIQILSRIQITPTNFTLSEVGETTQFSAILYVGDTPTPATFAWSLENDRADAFKLDATSGLVKSLKTGTNKATVKARLLTPTQYVGTEGLAIVAANVPIIVPVGGDPVPTTGNLRVVVNGMSRNIGANVTISGLNQSITDTTTFNNIPAGNYTITPNVVTVGGVNYNPTGGGEIYVAPGQNAEITVQYTKQSPPDVNSIQIVELYDTNGNILQQGTNVNVGDRITVIANTYRNGKRTNIGDVQFTMNNTQEGVQTVQGKSSGVYRSTFTITEPGAINVTAYNQLGGSVTGQINANRLSTYTIRINAPGTLIVGQCSPVTAVVLQDGVETNIPVQIDLSGGLGRISDDPCGVPQPLPTARTQPILVADSQPSPPIFVAAAEAAQTGTAVGGAIVDTGAFGTSGGVSTGGEFDQIAFIDQGQNAI
jgi:hypothetical protein